MTEKRFRFQDTVYDEVFLKKIIYDSVSEREYDCTLKCQDDLCGLLNELYEENQKLKDENIKLKSDNSMLRTTVGRNDKENIPLKQQSLGKEDKNIDYRNEFNKRIDNNKYFKNNGGIKSIDIYSLITDALYTRLDIFFENGEWDDYMLSRIADKVVKEMQEDNSRQ
jgi:hypothetical protein